MILRTLKSHLTSDMRWIFKDVGTVGIMPLGVLKSTYFIIKVAFSQPEKRVKCPVSFCQIINAIPKEYVDITKS